MIAIQFDSRLIPPLSARSAVVNSSSAQASGASSISCQVAQLHTAIRTVPHIPAGFSCSAFYTSLVLFWPSPVSFFTFRFYNVTPKDVKLLGGYRM